MGRPSNGLDPVPMGRPSIGRPSTGRPSTGRPNTGLSSMSPAIGDVTGAAVTKAASRSEMTTSFIVLFVDEEFSNVE
ncbi:hypothetical protein BCR34DRAFT_572253 [Clohesyomyces aquaticus]|uniref:Uncharacterized protein n=1 Tax=Clohesyomyces aquaticus TaxID=1231657 RepID=A0A1Y1Z471_9PLEO|nr:hypothetical protein BCR34DRAFT_572253 [Clohesyomyces aquaticus]